MCRIERLWNWFLFASLWFWLLVQVLKNVLRNTKCSICVFEWMIFGYKPKFGTKHSHCHQDVWESDRWRSTASVCVLAEYGRITKLQNDWIVDENVDCVSFFRRKCCNDTHVLYDWWVNCDFQYFLLILVYPDKRQ